MNGRLNTVAVMVLACAVGAGATADVIIETVTVGNPGNPGELSGQGAGGQGFDRVCGTVSYVYELGTHEITTKQYCEFLNAVAATDPYALYNPYMWNCPYDFGCRIQRHGEPGSYTYGVAADWAQRPVNYVTWADAARFCNWLHNGQPTGPQGLSTTEDGSYLLNGAMSEQEVAAVIRQPDATWVIPTEDEWYKAAYHRNDGPTGNYWDFATRTSGPQSNLLTNPDPGNNANFRVEPYSYTIGPPYMRTEVGEFENSFSEYGTYDQGGNIYEWTETAGHFYNRVYKGGAYGHLEGVMHAAYRSEITATLDGTYIGFRVAMIPEPPLLGDLNCDDVLDFGDINPFILALTNGAGYYQQFPDCDRNRADINKDGFVDFGDINPFVDLLVNP